MTELERCSLTPLATYVNIVAFILPKNSYYKTISLIPIVIDLKFPTEGESIISTIVSKLVSI